MKAVVFVPDCCSRGRVVADKAKLSVGVRAELDRYLCGELKPMDAVKEVVQLCKKADGRKAVFGWTLIVEGCVWGDVEDVVYAVGGDIVYMR
ncbi:MAG: hypothetical protein ACO2O1_06620 [Candidatus Caldarchaeales archaeon]|jgi:hypothetical protein